MLDSPARNIVQRKCSTSGAHLQCVTFLYIVIFFQIAAASCLFQNYNIDLPSKDFVALLLIVGKATIINEILHLILTALYFKNIRRPIGDMREWISQTHLRLMKKKIREKLCRNMANKTLSNPFPLLLLKRRINGTPPDQLNSYGIGSQQSYLRK